jgi:hypothetical protein
MAGAAKPNSVSREADYVLIGGQVTGSPNGLIDGVQTNGWNSPYVAYWQSASHYVEFTFNEDVNIWRSGTTSWKTYTAPFIIYRWESGVYQDVTSQITQTVTQITETQWEKTISNLPAGRYKFQQNGNLRLDSEWYIEAVNPIHVGLRLIAPESGWKRYDDNLPTYKRTGVWSYDTAQPSYYGGGAWWTNDVNAKLEFKFKGTKIRLLANTYNNKPNNVRISIDGGPEETFSCYSTTDGFQILAYEKTGLVDEVHTVIIQSPIGMPSSLNWNVDAIDIDDTGRLLHPDEVTNTKDLQIGNRIRCHYTAGSNAFGLFFGLGQETSDFIPAAASSVTPDGDFYFIYVDDDFKGRKKLIPDRNIQKGIAWDTLNTEGVASGSGLLLKYGKRITPIMTSDTTPSGRAYASSFYGGNDPWRAFDGIKNTDTGKWTSATQDGKGWIAYEFPTPTVVVSYRITGHYSGAWLSQNPKDWTFEGSNDGVNWDILDQQSGITWSRGAEQKTFDTENRTPYKHYRINITSIGNNSYRAVIGELELLEPISINNNYVFTLRLPTGGVTNTDKDNEWDNYIVNSTLNGTITAGDNTVWNWNGQWSWTSTTHPDGASYRTIRGYSPVSGHSRATTNTISANSSGFRPVLIVESVAVQKYLFQDGSEIKKYVPGSGWSIIGSAPATEAMFQVDGMTDLSIIDKAAIDSLVSSQPKLLMWTDAPDPTGSVTLTAVPKEHLIMPTEDITLPAQGITGFTLTASVTGASNLRVIASVDNGVTWKAWNGSSWVSVDPADLTVVKTNGMTPGIFNALTESIWNDLLNGGSKIRFAYYLDQDNYSDLLSVDLLTINGKPVATQTPTLDSIKVNFDELTIEGRLQDLERINAINTAKLNFKSNALLSSEKYGLHDLVVDTFSTNAGVDPSDTTATYDTINKEFTGAGKSVVMPVENLPMGRKKLILIPDGTPDVSYQYSLDGGTTWVNATPYTVIDISGVAGNQLKIKANLSSATSKLKGIAYSWA